MRKRLVLAFAILALFGLAISAFAYARTINTSAPSMSCCCKGDSCPMKKKDTANKETASCCDGCDCCSGDSCPMKNKDASAKDGASCCSGDSCPMKKKDTAATASEHAHDMKNVVMVRSEGGCCACCGHSKKHTDGV